MPNPMMSSRERLLRVLNREEPEKVPFNLNLAINIYHRLCGHLELPPGLDKPIGIWKRITPSLNLLDSMKIDIRCVRLYPHSWQTLASMHCKSLGLVAKEAARKRLSGANVLYQVISAHEHLNWKVVDEWMTDALMEGKATILKWHDAFTKGEFLGEAFYHTQTMGTAARC
jgi:hypothetical protein